MGPVEAERRKALQGMDAWGGDDERAAQQAICPECCAAHDPPKD